LRPVTTNVTAEDYERLYRLAAERRESVSEVVRALVLRRLWDCSTGESIVK